MTVNDRMCRSRRAHGGHGSTSSCRPVDKDGGGCATQQPLVARQYGAVGALLIPQTLAQAARLEGRGDWLITLAPIVSQAAKEWSLAVGEPYQPGGHTAWVAPARDRLGRPLALKVAWWHPEA